MNSVATRNVIINGYRIAYNHMGAGDPIVFIHGTPSSSYIWRSVATRLADNGYSVHMYDLLGFGFSQRPFDQGVDTSVWARSRS